MARKDRSVSPGGIVAVVAGVIALWLLLAGTVATVDIVAGLAVAAAVGAWAQLADL